MADTQVLALVGAVIASFGTNLRIFQLIYEDRLAHPARTSAFLNMALMVIVGGLLLAFVGPLAAALLSAVSLIFLGSTASVVLSRRDRRALSWGQNLIPSLHIIDLQVNYVHSLVVDGASQEALRTAVHDTLYHVLDEIARVLSLSPSEDVSHISLLLCIPSGRFRVICHRGIPAHRIPFIEAAFSYGEHPVGVAGIVASSLRTVYIPDLADEQDENVRHWIRVEEGERKEGSLYCFPIRRGVGPHPQTNALAVLSLTSVRKNAFDTKVVPNYLSQIAPKLEALIYIMTLHC